LAARASTGKGGPQVFTIPAHHGFADALAAGLLARGADGDLGLARLTLLLPSRRAVRAVTEGFVRLAGDSGRSGLLLPRIAVVGDLDLDETLGPLLDPLGAADIPPAADPVRRWLRLADLLRQVEGEDAGSGASLLRRAFEAGRTMDRLSVEGLTPLEVFDKALGVAPEMTRHWEANTRAFLMVQQLWIADLAERGEIDAPERRNRLFDHAARRWRDAPPAHPVVAAGVTSASPSLARLLRTVSELPGGAVVLPGFDRTMDADVWDELGRACAPAQEGEPPFAPTDAASHPQYHLKVLLARMGLSRDEVQDWPSAGAASSSAERGAAVSRMFLPAKASARWGDLADRERRFSGVRLMECAHPGEEAQAIAIALREAMEVPGRRAALVTPDRGLAGRVAAHLKRWGIDADDSAGRPLPQTPAGRLLLLLAEVLAENAAPVPLVALLSHPLVAREGDRAAWLREVRRLDLALRGPRRGPGLEPLRKIAGEARIGGWWSGVEATLAPLLAWLEPAGADVPLADLLDALVRAGEALCGTGLWGEADGRALSAMVEDLRGAAREVGTALDPRELHAVLRDAMDRVSVRPPWGGHPRVAIYGLLEARMTRADFVICAGLTEGTWPAAPAQDALLPPAVLRALGVPGGDFRIGLSAHDLASAMGAPEVLLSWARRDEGGPVIPSRFVLRIEAMLGREGLEAHRETRLPELARRIDEAPPEPPHPRPQPMPSAAQRQVSVSATGLDRLRGDPYQFYAGSILNLRSLDALDAEPSAAWRGEVAHLILERWHAAGDPPDGLRAIALATLEEKNAHPLMRALWWPRLSAALDTFHDMVLAGKARGREVAAVEAWGEMEFRGVKVLGRADRIDRLPDGTLAIVDYKTGGPPSNKRVEEGFSLQLGTLGLIAGCGNFVQRDADRKVIAEASGETSAFEYWSLAKARSKAGGFGYVATPIKLDGMRSGMEPEDFLPRTEAYLSDALDRWILGDEPFTARLNPELPSFTDYDQLMRLAEWLPTLGSDGENAA
jgi:ATP-dependent helicase/nuclease subunit B